MHLVKVIGEHIVNYLPELKTSSKLEKIRGRFKESYLIEGDTNKKNLPPASFCLLKHDVKIHNQRALSIRVPHVVDWKPQPFFSDKIHKKCAQWKHAMASGILKFCIRSQLGNFQQNTLWSDLLVEELDSSCLHTLEYREHRALALL